MIPYTIADFSTVELRESLVWGNEEKFSLSHDIQAGAWAVQNWGREGSQIVAKEVMDYFAQVGERSDSNMTLSAPLPQTMVLTQYLQL